MNYEVKKTVRSVLEAVALLILLVIIIRALFTFQKYQPYEGALSDTDQSGFIALSYFGVDREGTDKLISEKELDEQLKALYDQGYVTITQQDVKDYYEKGKMLPEKSLYLMFEDGRRDTAIFAQKIMEKYNFKATMMSYVEYYSDNKSKFLDIDDLKEIEDTTYWELGTNGYRLSYINVFDREGNYLGDMDALEFNRIAASLKRDYNHYLMDYLRDEDGVPRESKEEMLSRISRDYELMQEAYMDGLGKMPPTYVLMHSNTGAFGDNDKVSAVNEKYIKELFAMNFNREGDCKNTTESSIYDLTRMQPQSYWATNHLLMRIKDDTDTEVEFVSGDTDKIALWNVSKGALEYQNETFFLTSEAKSTGQMRLNAIEEQADLGMHIRMCGNQIGRQTVYLRADQTLDSCIAVTIENNFLIMSESIDGVQTELSRIDLAELDSDGKRKTDVAEIDIREAGDRTLWIQLEGNLLHVTVDGKKAVEDLPVSYQNKGGVVLESAWSEEGWSQRNLADDVYDGIFRELYITECDEKAERLYNGEYSGLEKAGFKIKHAFNSIVDWFIKYL